MPFSVVVQHVQNIPKLTLQNLPPDTFPSSFPGLVKQLSKSELISPQVDGARGTAYQTSPTHSKARSNDCSQHGKEFQAGFTMTMSTSYAWCAWSDKCFMSVGTCQILLSFASWRRNQMLPPCLQPFGHSICSTFSMQSTL